MTFDKLVEYYRLEPADISKKYGIPVRTVYSWYQGTRRPPEYLITMIQRLEDQAHGLERRSKPTA